jgi:hypothetical protein
MQPLPIKRRRPALGTGQNFSLVFRKCRDVVQCVDEQEFGRELLRKARLHSELELLVAKPKHVVLLVVVDQGAVVELPSAEAC